MAKSTIVDPYAGIATAEEDQNDPYAGIATPESEEQNISGKRLLKPAGEWEIAKGAKDWYNKAQENVQTIKEARNAPERFLRLVGGAAGSATDIPIEAAKTTYRSLPENVQGGLKAAGKTAMNAALINGKSLADILPIVAEKVSKIMPKDEQKRKNVESLINILGVAPVLKSTESVAKMATKAKIPKVVGEGMKGIAKSNVGIEMRPGQTGARLGFEAENALEHELVGKPREVALKADQMLKDLNAKAAEIGAASPERVNLPSLFERAKAKFTREGNPEEFDKIDAFFKEELANYSKAFPDPDISLSDAMKLRTYIGDKAAFVGKIDKSGMVADPDAGWKEEIYNKIYNDLKDEIHAKAGPELQEINRMQSEIIPVRQVALKRIPISESNLKLRPMDVLVGGAGAGLGATLADSESGNRAINALISALALAAGRRIIGSKPVTQALYKAGSKISPTPKRPLKNVEKSNYPTGKTW